MELDYRTGTADPTNPASFDRANGGETHSVRGIRWIQGAKLTCIAELFWILRSVFANEPWRSSINISF